MSVLKKINWSAFGAGAIGGLFVVICATFVYWWLGAKSFWEVWNANSGWAAAIAAGIVGLKTLIPIKRQQEQQTQLAAISFLESELNSAYIFISKIFSFGDFIKEIIEYSEIHLCNIQNNTLSEADIFREEMFENINNIINLRKDVTVSNVKALNARYSNRLNFNEITEFQEIIRDNVQQIRVLSRSSEWATQPEELKKLISLLKEVGNSCQDMVDQISQPTAELWVEICNRRKGIETLQS